MNATFTAKIAAILRGDKEIPGLPRNKLKLLTGNSPTIGHAVSEKVFLKVARLQTLSHEAFDSVDIIGDDSENIANLTKSDVTMTMVSSAMIVKDAMMRIMFIERLIVEVVREAVPIECERFNAEYNAHEKGVITHIPMRTQRYIQIGQP